MISFALSLFIWIGGTAVYISTDSSSSWLHHPYYEFRVWILMVSLLFNIFLIYFVQVLAISNLVWTISVAFGVVPICSLLVVDNYVQTQLQKKHITIADSEVLNIELFDSISDQGVAEKNTRKISRILANLIRTSRWKLINQSLRVDPFKRQREIFEILEACDRNQLNYILMKVNLPQLFSYGLYFCQSKNTNTLDYIINKRDADLSTTVRASVIHALMRTRTLSFSKVQTDWALQSFSGCFGEDLTVLKNLLDSSGDYNNLMKLVYVDIKDESDRNHILRHICNQAREIVELDKLEDRKRVKILSDIDDTLYSSGGSFPAGADDRLPKHVVYPGVLQLFEEIDIFTRSLGNSLDTDKRESMKVFSEQMNFSYNNNFEDDGIGLERDIQELLEETKSKEYLSEELELYLKHRRNKNTTNIETESLTTFDGLEVIQSPPSLDSTNKTNFGIKVTLKVPWRPGGGEHYFICDKNMGLDSLQQKIQNEFGLPPWKQQLTLEPVLEEKSRLDWKHGNLAFLSARPNVYKDISEEQSYKIFQSLMKKNLLHTTPTMLTGSLSSGMRAMILRVRDKSLAAVFKVYDILKKFLRRNKEIIDDESMALVEKSTNEIRNDNWRAVGNTKVDRFKKYSLLYPEYRFVFFGDDGQGDLYAAEELLKYFKKFQKKSNYNRLMYSFFHRVSHKGKKSAVFTSLKNPSPEAWKKLGISFFDTYIGAAVLCHDVGLISAMGLWRVAGRAREEMLTILEEYPDFDFVLIVNQLNDDIFRANEVLSKYGIMEQVEAINLKEFP